MSAWLPIADSLPRVAPALLIARLSFGGQISVLIPLNASLEEAARELQSHAHAQDVSLRVFRSASTLGALESTLAAMREGSPKPTLLIGEPLPEDGREAFDLYRARLPQDRAILLLMSEEGARSLLNESHHVESLIQQVELLDLEIPTLDEEEVMSRLASLRRWSGRTDAEVLALAEGGELPPDPDYVEWLILLGRGDLLEAR